MGSEWSIISSSCQGSLDMCFEAKSHSTEEQIGVQSRDCSLRGNLAFCRGSPGIAGPATPSHDHIAHTPPTTPPQARNPTRPTSRTSPPTPSNIIHHDPIKASSFVHNASRSTQGQASLRRYPQRKPERHHLVLHAFLHARHLHIRFLGLSKESCGAEDRQPRPPAHSPVQPSERRHARAKVGAGGLQDRGI